MAANMAAKTQNRYISAYRWATIKNEVTILIFSKSKNRFLAVAIVWECYFPRWRPIWPPKHKNRYISLVSCCSLPMSWDKHILLWIRRELYTSEMYEIKMSSAKYNTTIYYVFLMSYKFVENYKCSRTDFLSFLFKWSSLRNWCLVTDKLLLILSITVIIFINGYYRNHWFGTRHQGHPSYGGNEAEIFIAFSGAGEEIFCTLNICSVFFI